MADRARQWGAWVGVDPGKTGAMAVIVEGIKITVHDWPIEGPAQFVRG